MWFPNIIHSKEGHVFHCSDITCNHYKQLKQNTQLTTPCHLFANILCFSSYGNIAMPWTTNETMRGPKIHRPINTVLGCSSVPAVGQTIWDIKLRGQDNRFGTEGVDLYIVITIATFSVLPKYTCHYYAPKCESSVSF